MEAVYAFFDAVMHSCVFQNNGKLPSSTLLFSFLVAKACLGFPFRFARTNVAYAGQNRRSCFIFGRHIYNRIHIKSCMRQEIVTCDTDEFQHRNLDVQSLLVFLHAFEIIIQVYYHATQDFTLFMPSTFDLA